MSASTHRRTCTELGVCQDRCPPCDDCPPISEGTRTARLLLDKFPLPERPPFYIFPRTLEEAFGPGHRTLDLEPEPMHPADQIVVRASCVALAAVVGLQTSGVLS